MKKIPALADGEMSDMVAAGQLALVNRKGQLCTRDSDGNERLVYDKANLRSSDGLGNNRVYLELYQAWTIGVGLEVANIYANNAWLTLPWRDSTTAAAGISNHFAFCDGSNSFGDVVASLNSPTQVQIRGEVAMMWPGVFDPFDSNVPPFGGPLSGVGVLGLPIKTLVIDRPGSYPKASSMMVAGNFLYGDVVINGYRIGTLDFSNNSVAPSAAFDFTGTSVTIDLNFSGCIGFNYVHAMQVLKTLSPGSGVVMFPGFASIANNSPSLRALAASKGYTLNYI